MQPFHLPLLLQRVIGLVFWCPSLSTSTSEEVSFVFGSRTNGDRIKPINYFGSIQFSAKAYTSAINKYYENGGECASVLDKPNAHRLLELAFHSVPAYGHALNISELVFEQFHRGFKDWLEKNSNLDSHLSAVEISIAQDWLRRAFALYKTWNGGSAIQVEEAERGLIRLMIGEEAVPYFAISGNSTTQELQSFRQHLAEAFASPVVDQIRSSSQSSLLHKTGERWEARNVQPKPSQQPHAYKYNASIELLQSFLRSDDSSSEFELKSFANARFMRREQFLSYRPTSSYNTIVPGCFISAKVCNPHQSVLQPHRNHHIIRYYYVRYIIQEARDDEFNLPWVMVSPVCQIEHYGNYYIDYNATFQCLQLTTSVRTVGKMHSCTSNCSYVMIGNRLCPSHDETNRWEVITGKDGFPPHMG